MSHYSKAQEIGALNEWAEVAAKEVFKQVRKIDKKAKPLLIYRGMSGIATSTALASAMYRLKGMQDFGMMYVRKKEEKSHGSRVEHSYNYKHKYVIVFVDDFVTSGDTRSATLQEVKHLAYSIFHTDFKYNNDFYVCATSGDRSGGGSEIITCELV